MNLPEPKRIVILGGGFAGISTARELGRLAKHTPSIEVHLLNNENYFVFQPMLPDVVSCGIEPSHILNPIRHLCPDVHFHQAIVSHIDLQERHVTFSGKDTRRNQTLAFDHIVLSLGLTMNLSRVPGMAEHTLPLKTMGDAFHLRNHVLNKLEEADSERNDEQRKIDLTFITIGGGFSGVETMAALNDMVKSVLPYYPRAQATGCRMVLIHSQSQILRELKDGLAKFAQEQLARRGIEMLLETKVEEATPNGVSLSNGTQLAAGTVICTVGNSPHSLMQDLDLPKEHGRLLTEPTLTISGFPHCWALGDSAAVPDVKRGGFCPPTAQYAIRQGKHCARNIWATLNGKPMTPFKFGGLGQMAVVGRYCGVAQIFNWKISGIIAWFLWRWVYLMKLPGLQCKIRVGIDWVLEMLFPHDITKIETQRTEQLKHAHYQMGETIIRQGEIGDRFYVIESGKVEILRQEAGKPEERLATRSAGDSFGELALLQATARAATVRCLTAVDVVMFNRNDFLSLVGSYDVLKTQMDKEVTSLSQFWDKRNTPNQPPHLNDVGSGQENE
jgi:NADH dehydrogenase